MLQFNCSLNDLLNSDNCYDGWYLVTKYIIENYSHEFILGLLKDKEKAKNFLENSYDNIKDYYLKKFNSYKLR